MKEVFKIIKENFILLLGTGLFIYGLFSFSSDKYCDVDGGFVPDLFPPCLNPAPFYYYDQASLILLTIGVIFIAIGLLKMRKKN